MDIESLARTIAIYALPVLFAITLHEAAHGYVARHFGDMTAFAQGRISVNPARHIEFFGTIVVPALLLVMTGGKFAFGWAKPVPVNYSALRKPKLQMALEFVLRLAVAGVVVNFAIMTLNLLPILPLDGGRILVGLLPGKLAWAFARTEVLGSYFFLAFTVFSVYDSTVNDGKLMSQLFRPLNQLAVELLRGIART
jgi:Zn-dependent protease